MILLGDAALAAGEAAGRDVRPVCSTAVPLGAAALVLGACGVEEQDAGDWLAVLKDLAGDGRCATAVPPEAAAIMGAWGAEEQGAVCWLTVPAGLAGDRGC